MSSSLVLESISERRFVRSSAALEYCCISIRKNDCAVKVSKVYKKVNRERNLCPSLMIEE